jgi:hypothetical protein
MLAVTKVTETFGIVPLSAPRPKLLASFAKVKFSTAARLKRHNGLTPMYATYRCGTRYEDALVVILSRVVTK